MNRKIEIISQIEVLLKELKALEGGGISPREKATPRPTGRTFSGLTAEIFALVNEGFFKDQRSLSDVQHKLRMGGISKPVTSLQKPLTMLVRKKILDRDKPKGGEKGQFKYFERNK